MKMTILPQPLTDAIRKIGSLITRRARLSLADITRGKYGVTLGCVAADLTRVSPAEAPALVRRSFFGDSTSLRHRIGWAGRVVAMVSLVAMISGQSAWAATTYYWDTTTTSTWATGANWSNNATSGGTTGTVPASTDSAVFNQSSVNGAETVNLGAAASIAGITFANTGTTLIDSNSITSYALSIGTGGITINSGAGAVTIGNATDPVTITLGGAESWTNNSANTLTIVNNVTNSTNLLTLAGSGAITINGVIGSGNGGLTDNDTGTVTLTNANTYTGATTVNRGILDIGGGGSTGSISSSSALALGGGTLSLTRTGGVIQTFNGLTLNGGADSTINNTVSGDTLALGAITRTASQYGTLTFATTTGGITTSFTNVNNIIGPWAVIGTGANTEYAVANGSSAITGLAGTAAADGSGLTDTTGVANYNLAAGGGTVLATVSLNTIRYTGGSGTTAPGATSFTVNGLLNAGTGLWTIGTNKITIGSNKELVVNTANADITISSVIADNGANASFLTKTGAGTLTLTGANTYSGGTVVNAGTLILSCASGASQGTMTVNAGTLKLGNAGAYNSNSPQLTVNSGGTFDLGGITATQSLGILQLNAGGTVTNSGGAATLKIGGGNTASPTVAGVISDGMGTVSLNKTGSGTVTISGANTYTGTTTVNAGTLQVGNGSAGSISSSSALALGGGTFYLDGLNTATTNQTVASLSTTAGTASVITLKPNGNLTTLTITSNTVAAGAASLLNFNYSNGTTNGSTLGNDYVVWSPTLTDGIINPNYTVTDTGGTGFATVAGGKVVRLADPGNAGLPVSGGVAGNNYFVNQNYSTTVTSTPGSLVEALSGAVAAGTVTVDTTGLGSGANLALGTNQLTITSGGGFYFAGANPYTISASTGGGIANSAAAGSLTLYNNNSNATGVTISAPILDNGGVKLTLNGTGTTVLSGVNTYSGATTINGGTLTINGSGELGSGNYSGTISNAGTFNYNSSASQTLSGIISGAGALNVAAGTLILSNANSYSGTTTITGGTLQANNASALSTAAVTINGGTLQWGSSLNTGTLQAGTITINSSGGTIDTNGYTALLKNYFAGSGNLTIFGNGGSVSLPGGTASAYTGNILIKTGELTAGQGANLNAHNPVGSGTITIGDPGVGSGTAQFDLTIQSGDNYTFPNNFVVAGTNETNILSQGAGGRTANANGFSGTITLNGGSTLTIQDNANGSNSTGIALSGAISGSGNIILVSQSSASNIILSSTSINNSGTITNAGTNGSTTANITGTIGANVTQVYENGTTPLVLSGANTAFSGGVTLQTGTLEIDINDSALGTGTFQIGNSTGTTAVTVDSLSARNITNALKIYQNFTFTGTANLTQGTGAITLLTNGTTGTHKITVSANTLTLGGIVADGGNGYGLTKAGTGTLTLSGANSFGGVTTVENGSLLVVNNAPGTAVNGALGNATSAVALGDATSISSNYSPSLLIGGAFTVARNVTVGSANTATSGVYTIGGSTANTSTFSGNETLNQSLTVTQLIGGTLNLTGNITSGATGTQTVTFNNAGSVSQSTGVIGGGTGTIAVAQTGAGATTLFGANTFTGGVTINAGTLILGSAGALNSTAGSENAVTFGAATAGTLTLGGNNVTISNLTGSATGPVVQNNLAGTATLTVGNNANLSGTYAGIIQNGAAGTLALTKAGTGTLTLTGANTYTGATSVNAGTLTVSGAGTLAGTTNLTVTSGATFSYQPTTIGTNLTLGTGSTLNLNNGSILALAWNSTTANKITALGAATVGTGVGVGLNMGTGFNSGTTYTILQAASGLNTGTYYVLNPTNYTATVNASSGTAVTITPTTATALTTAYWEGNKITGSSTSGLDNSWATSTGTVSNWSNNGPTYTATALVPASTTSVVFSASGASNDNPMVLGASMSVAGITFSDGATSTLNDDGNTLTVGTGGITISNASTVTLNPAITLGGAQSWTNNSTNTFTVSDSVNNGSNGLTIAGTGNTTISGVIGNGSGTLTKSGAGTLTLSGANTYTGGTMINGGGTVQVNAGGTLGAATGALTFGTTNGDTTLGTLTLNNANATVGSLTAQTFSAGANYINVSTGNTLTVNGNVLINTTANTAANTNGASLTFNPSGLVSNSTFTVTGATSTIIVGEGLATVNATNQTPTQILDMRNISNFNGGTLAAPLASFRIGDDAASGTYNNFGTSTVYLPASSTIYTTELGVSRKATGGITAGQVAATLYLGSGTTNLYAANIYVGENQDLNGSAEGTNNPPSGLIAWNSGVTTGSLNLYNSTGGTNPVTAMYVGYKTDTGSTEAHTGTVDLTNGTVTGAITDLYVGYERSMDREALVRG